MKKIRGVLTGRIFFSSAQGEKLWFTLDENEEAVAYVSAKEGGDAARRILKSAEKWLIENRGS